MTKSQLFKPDLIKKIKFNDGILVVNKPINITSAQFLDDIKKLSVDKLKIGHSGTLDKNARGILVLGIGKSTKQLPLVLNSVKTYKTTIIFGNKTSTGDGGGEIISNKPYNHINIDLINEKLEKHFTGQILQKAPVYSALKINGNRLSDLTRKGIEVEPPTRSLHVFYSKCTKLKLPIAEFELKVSSGFYVRSFAEDFSNILGTDAYCLDIYRISNGPFKELDAIKVEQFSQNNINANMIRNTILLENNLVLPGLKSETIQKSKILNKK